MAEIKIIKMSEGNIAAGWVNFSPYIEIQEYVGPDGAQVLFDGKNNKTYTGEWVMVDLGKAYSIKQVYAESGEISSIAVSNNGIDFSGFAAGNKVRYLRVYGIKAVDELIIHIANTFDETLIVNDIYFVDNDIKIVSVDNRRSMGAEVIVHNISDEPQDISVYFALYDANGIFVDVGSASKEIEAGVLEVITASKDAIEADITEGFVMKAFVWTSAGMAPISDVEIINNYKY